MTEVWKVFSEISPRLRELFASRFLALYTLDKEGPEWVSLVDVVRSFSDYEQFRYSFSWSAMVLFTRELCLKNGLTQERRGSYPHELEGYYGLTRKA
jgi:hypothetical protein